MKVFKHHWCIWLLKIQFQNTRLCHEIIGVLQMNTVGVLQLLNFRRNICV